MKETKFWTWHIFAGVGLLFLLGFHFVYTHIGTLVFGVPDNITMEASRARDAQFLYLVFFVFLLGLGLYHGLYGLKNILCEVVSCKGCQRVISVLLLVLGIALFAFGSYSSYLAHQGAGGDAPCGGCKEVKNGK